MSAARPPDWVPCLALIGPVGVGLAFAASGPAWSLWAMVGVAAYSATIVALIGFGSGHTVPRPLLYLTVVSLFAIPAASFYVMAWVVTGSWILSTVIGAVLGYVAFGVLGWFSRSRRAPDAAGSLRRPIPKVR